MVIAVRTERGPDGLEVVKEAETDADRVRLATEAAILRRSAHPGVTEVLGATESVLRLRHCGSPLARLGPVAPDHAAAIVRAVAEIVDALHRQGIVHRRIDTDHVVVSERGRPSLVGFGEAGEGNADEQAGDVAALGAMLNRLLDDGSEALWSPAHRGVRAATRRKRAMSAFRTAAAAASRPDAGQRPSAHQFANAIGEALPGLTLPTPPGADPEVPDGDGPGIPDGIDPTADLGWSDFDLSFLAVDEQVAPGGEPERNPAAPRDPYAVLESLASPEPTSEPDPAAVADADVDAGTDAVDELPADDAPTIDDRPDEGSSTDPIIAAMRSALESERGRAPAPSDPVPSEQAGEADATGDPRDIETTSVAEVAATPGAADPEPDAAPDPEPEPGPEAPPITAGPAPAPNPFAVPVPADRPAEALRPPSIQIRPGPADPEPADPGRPSRRLQIAVAVVVLVIGAVAGSVIARAVDPFGADSASASPETTTSTVVDDGADEDEAPTTPPPLPDGCEPVALPGPLGSDGCPAPIALDGRTATVGDTAVELGQDGDLVVIADSDCDGIATPVVLRPSSGEVFAFPGWSLDEAIEVVATDVVDGAESIEVGGGPCPDVVVTDRAGIETVVAP